MKITGRHMDVTPALKRYIRARFERLERYDVSPDRLEIVLSVTKLQHTAEVVCSIRGKRFQAKTSTREMYATVDQLVDRLDGQIRKYKERRAEHKGRQKQHEPCCLVDATYTRGRHLLGLRYLTSITSLPFSL